MAKLLTANDLLKSNNGSVASVISLIREMEKDYGRSSNAGAGRVWSTRVYSGIDPSLWNWYDSVSGGKPEETIARSRELESTRQQYQKPGDIERNRIAEAEYQARLSGNYQYNPQTGQTVATDQGSRTLGVPVNQALAVAAQSPSISPSILDQAMQSVLSQGYTINPNKNLTSLDVAEFLKRAEAEVSPYYAEQLKLGRESYLRSAGYSTDTILDNERKLEQKYGKDLRIQTENFAETGFAQSGRRIADESELANVYQKEINEGRRRLAYDEGNRAIQFAEKYGSSNLPFGLELPTLREAPQVNPGISQFGRSERTLPLYNISGDILKNIMGSQQKEQVTGTRGLAQFYEEQERTRRTLPL